MVATLTDQKRTAIAEKLAEIKAVQEFIVANEQQLLNECNDADLRNRLEEMLEDDRKNAEIVETVIIQYGVQAKPTAQAKQAIEQAAEMMKNSGLNLYDKLAKHELFKHEQVISGLVVHKAAQIAGKDVEEALAPLNAVNFENRAHQEQLKGMLEYVGTRELTGEEPDLSIWARVKDAMAAMTGVVGSAVTQTADKEDMDIMDIIFLDHQKAKTLMREIKKTNDSQKIQEYFGQLYKDLLVHSKAEEEVVYPGVRSFYGDEDTQELYDEQVELERVLNSMKKLEATSSEFSSKLEQVKNMVGDHTRQEESTMFAAMRKNLSAEQREQMATQFKEAKKQLASKF